MKVVLDTDVLVSGTLIPGGNEEAKRRLPPTLQFAIARDYRPMWRLVVFLLPALAWTAQLRVEVRSSDVWVIRNGHENQLTHDGKSKPQAVLSPSRNRIAYYEQCPEAEHCTPPVVLLDLEGHRVVSFQPKHQAVPPVEPCSSILSVAWVGNNAIAAECHINPSLNEYIETDISTGQTTRDLLGYGFTLSPDGTQVAHVGWMVHFAPPYAQSNYLQIDHTTIYPLPEGTSPIEQKGLTEPPKVIHEHGLTYSGIHEFVSGLFWSPDSQRVALIDCTYDWTANNPGALSAGDGRESNRRCSIAVVSPSGELALFPLTDVSLNDLSRFRLSWISPRQLTLRAGDVAKDVTVP